MHKSLRSRFLWSAVLALPFGFLTSVVYDMRWIISEASGLTTNSYSLSQLLKGFNYYWEHFFSNARDFGFPFNFVDRIGSGEAFGITATKILPANFLLDYLINFAVLCLIIFGWHALRKKRAA